MQSALIILLSALSLRGATRLLPVPASMHMGEGRLALAEGLRIGTEGSGDARLDASKARLTARVAKLTGRTSGALLRVRVEGAGEDESYRLEVTRDQATLTSPGPLGAMHGLETFYQLIEKNAAGWGIDSVTIEDHPRFAWRGLMIDVSRHFMPVDVILRNLDGMAAVKLNVFHWHLSDDQGFRAESKRFPKLYQLGSDGDYYTQDQIREVLQYARERGIRVVPEFGVPAHAASWLVGYPELARGPGPFQIVRSWGGYHPSLDVGNPAVLKFLDGLFGEMAMLFPDRYFHVGGDEVAGQRAGLPAFYQQLHDILARHGKRMVGWDEIAAPTLPRDVVIQRWRRGLVQGHDQMMSIVSTGYYLDQMEPAWKLYARDPGPGANILGGEACMWTEFVSAENIEGRIWPRTGAVAERLWSAPSVRNVPDLYRRLALLDAELDDLGLRHNRNYLAMLERLAGPTDFDAWKTLADVLEPGGLGLRRRVTPGSVQSTPLNRLVDVVRPDSAVARHFAALTSKPEIRAWLQRRAAINVNHPASKELARRAQAALAGRKLSKQPGPVGDLQIAVRP